MKQESRILIVDDCPNDVDLLRLAFAREGVAIPVDILQTGREAIAHLARVDPLPRLMLLDVKLPDIPGLEVLRFLRRDDRFKEIPIIILTSIEGANDLRRAYEFGASSYLTKPVNFNDFRYTIAEIKRRWLQ